MQKDRVEMQELIDRLNDEEQCIDAIDDAINEIKNLYVIANFARSIYMVAKGSYKRPVTICQHGNSGSNGSSAWFCDECFVGLGSALSNAGFSVDE